MKVNVEPKANLLFNAYNLFFVIVGMQVAIGITKFARGIFEHAGNDSWISVIIAGLFSHFILQIILKTLEQYKSADLFGINYDVFGKWIGGFISTLFILYLFAQIVLLSNSYVEIIQAWLFPTVKGWLFNVFGMILIIYGVTGGLRVVVGVTVFTFFATSWMILLFYYPLQFAEWNSLLPIFDTPVKDILAGSHEMALSLAGFEIIYVLYPYVKDKKRVKLYSHMGILFTNLLYLATMITSIVYFSGEQLLKTIWPTLSFFKIVTFPFIERFEFIAISIWLLLVLSSAIIPAWAASYGAKRIYGIKQKYALYAGLSIMLFSNFMVTTYLQIEKLGDLFSNASFYVVYTYPLVLFLLVKLKKKYRNKKERQTNEEN